MTDDLRARRLAKLRPVLAISLIALTAAPLAPATAGREDRIQRAESNVERDAARAEERAAQAAARAADEQARAERRGADQAIEQAARATADADRAAADQAEAAARAAQDAAEEAARRERDAARDAEDAAEDAARAAEEAAEEAAEAAEEAAEESAERLREQAHAMRDVASEEQPEFDRHGFPARRAEIIALDQSATAQSQLASQGFVVIDSTRVPALDAQVTRLRVPDGQTIETALNAARLADPAGVYDVAHYYAAAVEPAGVADAPAARRSGAAAAATARRGLSFVRVGMIDTPVERHPALGRVRLTTQDYGSSQQAPASHGTAVASLLARNGAASIAAVNVFRGSADAPFTSPDALVRAIGWLVAERVSVINISLTGPRNAVLDQIIARAARTGHLIVAAAGNGGPTAAPAYPAALPDVIAVTAVDANRRIYRYANQGAYVRLAARGVGISAAAPGGRSATYSGTSFATPLVAVRLSRCLGTNGGTVRGCISALEREAIDLGSPGPDPIYGHGLIE